MTRSPAYSLGYSNGHPRSVSPSLGSLPVAMRLGDKLVGSEDIWEAGLQQYQRKREAEVDDLASLTLEDIVSHPPSMSK